MEIGDIIPANGAPQRIYCEQCGTATELAFVEFDEVVSGIAIRISGLPTLRCPHCGHEQLPDRSRFAIVTLHREAWDKSSSTVTVIRQKCTANFGFTAVLFNYDPDDYFYLPGLYRSFNQGFLQPVFFNRGVIFKYDNAPGYRLKFASTTYGQIVIGDSSISFGMNRHGNVVMWLGDIATLAENEQYYLRSENIASDHALGSEFYDGQLEAIFTARTKEDKLFQARSEFLSKSFDRFGIALGHLEAEAYDLAFSFTPPVFDTTKERRHVADTLNKIYIESLDNKALGKIVSDLGIKLESSGSIKRLEAILQTVAPHDDINSLTSPLFILYDLRVVYSHLVSATDSSKLIFITERLGLPFDASLFEIYSSLLDGLVSTFTGMAKIMETGSLR